MLKVQLISLIYGNVKLMNFIRGAKIMGIIVSIFYGFVGLVILFFIVQYAINSGIDNSKEVKAFRSELKEIKKQLNDLGGK
ncbi:hypothetical protein FQP34_15165 [Peribacillus simplex]|uniref:DUF4083 domain-containing protein n=1 Tax=Peribacillus simplex TaxID=1478 RepID=A0A8B5XX06_9BACI|nr:hypothetical protein FQP34_15165 [Peribacillus simplex]